MSLIHIKPKIIDNRWKLLTEITHSLGNEGILGPKHTYPDTISYGERLRKEHHIMSTISTKKTNTPTRNY